MDPVRYFRYYCGEIIHSVKSGVYHTADLIIVLLGYSANRYHTADLITSLVGTALTYHTAHLESRLY